MTNINLNKGLNIEGKNIKEIDINGHKLTFKAPIPDYDVHYLQASYSFNSITGSYTTNVYLDNSLKTTYTGLGTGIIGCGSWPYYISNFNKKVYNYDGTSYFDFPNYSDFDGFTLSGYYPSSDILVWEKLTYGPYHNGETPLIKRELTVSDRKGNVKLKLNSDSENCLLDRNKNDSTGYGYIRWQYRGYAVFGNTFYVHTQYNNSSKENPAPIIGKSSYHELFTSWDLKTGKKVLDYWGMDIADFGLPTDYTSLSLVNEDLFFYRGLEDKDDNSYSYNLINSDKKVIHQEIGFQDSYSSGIMYNYLCDRWGNLSYIKTDYNDKLSYWNNLDGSQIFATSGTTMNSPSYPMDDPHKGIYNDTVKYTLKSYLDSSINIPYVKGDRNFNVGNTILVLKKA